MTKTSICAGIVLALGAAAPQATAEELLTVAEPGTSRAWDTSIPEYGARAGVFGEEGLRVEVANTESVVEALQAVIAGSADIGMVALPVFLGAAMQGAPIVMISSKFYGASDYVWYVRDDSPIRSIADITPGTTVGASRPGGSVHFHLLELIEQYGIEPEIVFTGPSGATITLVMSGQVEVGSHGNGLLGVPAYESGELRIVAFGSDIETMREVSVRGMVVSEETLANRREVLERFLRGYQRTLDWMYEEDQAVEWFAEQTLSSLDEARRVVRENYPKEALAVGPVTGIELSVQQAIDTERISEPPTAEDLSRLFRTVWIPGGS